MLIFNDTVVRGSPQSSGVVRRWGGATASPIPAPPGWRQAAFVSACLALVFTVLAVQLLRLGQRGEGMLVVAAAEPVAITHSRPDIVDRNGRLLATDVEVHSLYADPARVLDRDEVVERLQTVLQDLDAEDLRRQLGDRQRRFLWIRRGLSPRVAQAVHDLGLPGLSFRKELRRAYPLGALAGHILGAVNADNRGIAGIERHIDEVSGVEAVHTARPADRPPVRMSIEVAAQAALEYELGDTVKRLDAAGAAAVIMDAASGEIVAASSLPRLDPSRAQDAVDPAKRDRLHGGTYELGSIMKAFTVAMALDLGRVSLDTVIDVRKPVQAAGYEIKDLHPAGRPLSVSEVFTHSSNVGTAHLALDAGSNEQKLFLARAGLLSGIRTEAGPVAHPQLPARWDRIETVTISYGHGMAVAPLQFAAAGAALVNGGLAVQPTYLRRGPGAPQLEQPRVVSSETSTAIRKLMRLNVTESHGTGRRAEVPGLEIGGKTGTADIAGPRGYKNGGVISSFFAAYPMSAPRYVALVMVFEPKPKAETGGKVLAGVTAAPATARILERLGPLLEQ